MSFQHAVCAYLLQAHYNGWCGSKVQANWSQAVLTAFNVLREQTDIPTIVRDSYEVFVICVEALASEEEVPVDALLARGRTNVERITEKLSRIMEGGIVFGYGLSQMNQLVKHVMTWMALLLEKNKKCKKPMTAKEPV